MMKKNVVLPIAAFGLAIGTAFATLLAPQTVYVRGVMAQGAPYECISTQVSCDNTGTDVCQVSVQLRNGSSVIARSSGLPTGTPFTYQTGCVDVLKNTNSTVLNSPLAGNDRPISIQ